MQTKSFGSAKVFEPEPAQVIEALNHFVKQLSKRDEVLSVWLIGSYHRKDYGPFSDLDVVIIVKRSNLRFLDRFEEYSPAVFPIPIDLFVYTVDEAEEMQTSSHRFWKYIEQNHTTLFERQNNL